MKIFDVAIPDDWDFIAQASAVAGESVRKCSPRLRDAVEMAVSELIENAIKYSPSPADTKRRFIMRFDGSTVSIAVSNTIQTDAKAHEVLKRLESIGHPRSAKDLYVERVHQLAEGTVEGSGLGLYRIAYEGEFDLQCSVHSGIITIVATKRI